MMIMSTTTPPITLPIITGVGAVLVSCADNAKLHRVRVVK